MDLLEWDKVTPWIQKRRDHSFKGVQEFIQFAQYNEGISDDEVKFKCHFVNYLNGRKLNVTEVMRHLICDGFLISYMLR